MTEQQLADMAAKVYKSLHWAGFLVAVSLVILLIDMQLKRAIGRQAIEASQTLNTLITAGWVKGASTRGPEAAGAGRDVDHGGAAGGPDVVADTGVAAGDDHPGDAGPVVEGAAPAGQGKRAAGNGRRARGTAGGS